MMPGASRALLEELSTCLMAGLTLDDAVPLRATLREALAQIRGIVAGDGEPALEDILADARCAAAERLQAAGIALDWPVSMIAGSLDACAAAALEAALRDLVSIASAHGSVAPVRVAVAVAARGLRLTFTLDRAFAPGERTRDDRFDTIARRIAASGGRMQVAAGRAFAVTLELPLGTIQ